MNEVFGDSFFFIALLNSADRFHPAAVSASQDKSRRLVTTHWVVMEAADALSAPSIRRTTAQFVRGMIGSKEAVVVMDIDPWFGLGLGL